MESKSESRAIVPFRHRHDGWTPERQDVFLERLRGTGCVTEACRAAGLSTTSAYRAFHRMPGFATAWEQALAVRRPMLEDAAFQRAVHGSLQPLTRLGKVIGQRRQYSDSLLRFLIERQDRKRVAVPEDQAELERRVTEKWFTGETMAKNDRLLAERLDKLAATKKKDERSEAIAFAERMTREGRAP